MTLKIALGASVTCFCFRDMEIARKMWKELPIVTRREGPALIIQMLG